MRFFSFTLIILFTPLFKVQLKTNNEIYPLAKIQSIHKAPHGDHAFASYIWLIVLLSCLHVGKKE